MPVQRWSAWGGLSALLFLLAAALVALYGWALRRGFDVTYEGFHLLNYAYPGEYRSSFTSFHLLVAKLLPAQRVSVVGYRVASLVAALLGATVFSWAFCRWSAARCGSGPRMGWAWPLCFIGCLVQYSVFPRTINYNTINSLAIAVFASAVLYYLSAPGRCALAFLALGALALGLDGFVKVSSCAAVLGSGGLVLGTAPGRAGGAGRPLLAVGAGLLAAIGLFGSVIEPLPAWYHDFRHETALLIRMAYNARLLERYVRDAFPIVQALAYPFGAMAALGGAWVYYRGRGLNRRWQHAAVLALAGLVLGAEAHRVGLYRNTHFNYSRSAAWPLGCVLVGTAMLLAARWRYTEQRWPGGHWRSWVVPLWLLILPLAAAFGTWNQLFVNALLESMYWMALLLLLHQLLPVPAQRLPALRLAFVALPALALAEQIAYGLVWAPYLQVENMFHQQTPLTVGAPFRPIQLLLDAPTARYFQEMRTALRRAGFRLGDPVLALYDAPGLVYALGGVSPGNAWYFGGTDARNCDALAKTRLDLRRAFLLVNEQPGAGVLACMAAHGLHFPADYVLVHQSFNPYSRSPYQWRPQQDTVRVYAPRLAVSAQ